MMRNMKIQNINVDNVRYRGKVSCWFYLIIIVVAAVLLPIIIFSAFVDTNISALVVCLLVFTAVELFCIPMIFNNYVELNNQELIIVLGFIKKVIPYSDINEISVTNDSSAALAASLDRIKIRFRNKFDIMVSVENKEDFLNEIKKYIPNTVV